MAIAPVRDVSSLAQVGKESASVEVKFRYHPRATEVFSLHQELYEVNGELAII
jgi:hypothetical protein